MSSDPTCCVCHCHADYAALCGRKRVRERKCRLLRKLSIPECVCCERALYISSQHAHTLTHTHGLEHAPWNRKIAFRSFHSCGAERKCKGYEESGQSERNCWTRSFFDVIFDGDHVLFYFVCRAHAALEARNKAFPPKFDLGISRWNVIKSTLLAIGYGVCVCACMHVGGQ